MKKIAVFASGTGTNFEAIAEAIENQKLHAEIVCVVVDKVNAAVIEKARKRNIDSFVFTAKDYASKEAYEKEIVAYLQEREAELCVLAGYMRLCGEVLLNAYEGRIINIHPSLLPAFKGKDAIGRRPALDGDAAEQNGQLAGPRPNPLQILPFRQQHKAEQLVKHPSGALDIALPDLAQQVAFFAIDLRAHRVGPGSFIMLHGFVDYRLLVQLLLPLLHQQPRIGKQRGEQIVHQAADAVHTGRADYGQLLQLVVQIQAKRRRQMMPVRQTGQ